MTKIDVLAVDRAGEPTLGTTWLEAAGSPMSDALLAWPPDLLAFTEVVLERAEAYRFALSPPPGERWPPARYASWTDAVDGAARELSGWVEDRVGALPELVAEEWRVLRGATQTPLEQLADGRPWRVCEALLTLHAIADEACAGLFVALDRSDGEGCLYRARGRELLARSGSLARFHRRRLRVLPKVNTPPSGRTCFSRYAGVHRPGLDTRWHKLPARYPGTDRRTEHVNLLLLPWPLRVRESDFRAVNGPVQGPAEEQSGFFEFVPSERLDLDLVDRMLIAARDEVESVDVVALPECAIEVEEIDGLEALLSRHGVVYLEAGVRERPERPGRLGRNWVHIGVSPGLEKGGAYPSDGTWFHLRQYKQHRWSLDESQILQYNLGGALHPRVRWWEAMEVPRPRLELVQVGEEITIVSLVCEDLAQNDAVAEVIRSVGPTGVITLLLDGPQLSSRWAARYASVLADDPGSAVLTLSSLGMVERSRPRGYVASSVVALWKDPVQGVREISLEAGAQGVVLTICGDRAIRRSADGRRPVSTGTRYFDVAVHQVRAAKAGGQEPDSRPAAPLTPPTLSADELSVLTGWAEGAAEALAHAPERALALLADARPGAAWRAEFGTAQPSPRLAEAIDCLASIIGASTSSEAAPTFDDVILAASHEQPGEQALETLARRVLRSTLEQLDSRRPLSQDRGRPDDGRSGLPR